MHLLNDAELLAAYASERSETAFATLVERHVALVYSSALRQVGNPHLAEEITQAVFIILARKAGRLKSETIVTGWLCRTAHFAACNARKAEQRRQQREQAAHMNSLLNEPETDAWPQIAPLLDEAVAQLSEADRNTIILRFYQQKPLEEVGQALGLSADAAHKRVSRALEKLRKIFGKRGLTLSATVIASTVAANSVQAAPVGLVVTVTAAAAKGAVIGGSTITHIKGALKLMAWSKMKMAIVAGAVVLLTAGTTASLIVHHRFHGPSPQIHIKARFIEIAKGSDDFLNSFAGILDADSAQTFLKTLESKRGVVTLSEPEIVTTSGRQSQMRTTQTIEIITNVNYVEKNSVGSEIFQTGKMEFGPILDIVPVVLPDGRIKITTTAQVIEFLGYADDSQLTPYFATNSTRQPIALPIMLPAIQTKTVSTEANLGDGQTLLMIFPEAKQISFSKTNEEREQRIAQHIAAAEKKNGEKTTIVLITSEIVDSAGNRIHPNAK